MKHEQQGSVSRQCYCDRCDLCVQPGCNCSCHRHMERVVVYTDDTEEDEVTLP